MVKNAAFALLIPTFLISKSAPLKNCVARQSFAGGNTVPSRDVTAAQNGLEIKAIEDVSIAIISKNTDAINEPMYCSALGAFVVKYLTVESLGFRLSPKHYRLHLWPLKNQITSDLRV
jgi:hypothetical protein